MRKLLLGLLLSTQVSASSIGTKINLVNGTVWFTDSGAPSSSVGDPGDFYLDTATGDVYQKQLDDTTWTNTQNLTGPAGAQGPQGDPGPAGPAGPPGSSAVGFLENNTATVNETTNPANGIHINGNITIPSTGDYELCASWIWSGNDGAQDTIIDVVVAGGTARLVQQEEPKDTGGTGTGGTNQRLPRTRCFVQNFASTGSTNFQLRVYGSAAGDSATIHEAFLKVSNL